MFGGRLDLDFALVLVRLAADVKARRVAARREREIGAVAKMARASVRTPSSARHIDANRSGQFAGLKTYVGDHDARCSPRTRVIDIRARPPRAQRFAGARDDLWI